MENLDWSSVPNGLSVIIPVYNERNTFRELLSRVEKQKLHRQIVIVDDGSTDGTREVLKELQAENRSDLVIHLAERNQGKGAAVRKAISLATGDIILVQDADLEYDPRDYPALLRPMLEGRADVVFGSRFLGGGAHRVLLFHHYIANRGLTFLSNLFTNLNLTDMEVGYKLFRRHVLEGITIRSDRFNFEPEITAKVAKKRVRIFEVPISYDGRTYDEGKKIGVWDGFEALWTILKYRFVD